MGVVIAILTILLAAVLGWLALRPAAAFAGSPQTNPIIFVMGAEKPAVDREALAKRLQELSVQPAPKDLKPGAMCYEMVGPPDHAEYVCPKCNQKTLYALPTDGQTGSNEAVSNLHHAIWVLNGELTGCRQLVKEIKGLVVELDESQFCRKCHPEAKEPRIGLIVRYPKQAESHRVWGVTCDDLRLIAEFMSGKTKHAGAADAESPIKDHLKRLEELLGIKAESIGANPN
jgi:hypothetical protein